jgi:hypothetical protein
VRDPRALHALEVGHLPRLHPILDGVVLDARVLDLEDEAAACVEGAARWKS